jgi:hypothetical protein
MHEIPMERMWLAGLAVLTLAGCKSQPEVEPYEVADEAEGERSELLDKEVEASGTVEQDEEWERNIEMSLDQPPEELGKTIDGEFDDWSDADFRSFRSGEHVVDGDHMWDGASDASTRVAARLGEGHLYMAVEVRDDTVIDAASVDPFADGVVVWMRDPELANLADDLPDTIVEEYKVRPQIGVLFTPDGQFWRRDEGPGGLYRRGIEAATVKTNRGYRVELAMKLGVLQQVGALPAPGVAFRVDVIDGDNPKRRGAQTTISTVPPEEEGARFALLESEGWYPYASLDETPPREDAVGRWRISKDGWTFDAIEVPPEDWKRFPKLEALERAMRKKGMLEEVCPAAKRESRIVESYTSRSGSERVALLACGTLAPEGRCPADAETNLFWLRLVERGDGWRLEHSVSANPEPLSQCPDSRVDGEPYYNRFSMAPLGMVDESVWAVGWHKHLEGSDGIVRQSGVWMLNADGSSSSVAEVQTSRTVADRRARTKSNSRVYLTPVDEKPGRDICEIERIEEQRCRGLNRRCRTGDRGRETIAHIKMWQPEAGGFERYMMSTHRNCDPPFQFGERDAYMLYHRGARLGVIKAK